MVNTCMPILATLPEELPDLIGVYLCGVTLAVEEDETPDPIAVGFYGAQAEVAHARDGTHPV